MSQSLFNESFRNLTNEQQSLIQMSELLLFINQCNQENISDERLLTIIYQTRDNILALLNERLYNVHW